MDPTKVREIEKKMIKRVLSWKILQKPGGYKEKKKDWYKLSQEDIRKKLEAQGC